MGGWDYQICSVCDGMANSSTHVNVNIVVAKAKFITVISILIIVKNAMAKVLL